jgi:hypothetical protein
MHVKHYYLYVNICHVNKQYKNKLYSLTVGGPAYKHYLKQLVGVEDYYMVAAVEAREGAKPELCRN